MRGSRSSCGVFGRNIYEPWVRFTGQFIAVQANKPRLMRPGKLLVCLCHSVACCEHWHLFIYWPIACHLKCWSLHTTWHAGPLHATWNVGHCMPPGMLATACHLTCWPIACRLTWPHLTCWPIACHLTCPHLTRWPIVYSFDYFNSAVIILHV